MTLNDACSDFEATSVLRAKGRYPDRQAVQFASNCMTVLQRLLDWSAGHSEFIQFARKTSTKSKPQDRVSFYLLRERSKFHTAPFWDAYPDKDPKLSLLVDPSRTAGGHGWPPELQERVRSRLDESGLLEPGVFPTVRFQSLIGERVGRDPVADLLAALDEALAAIKSSN